MWLMLLCGRVFPFRVGSFAEQRLVRALQRGATYCTTASFRTTPWNLKLVIRKFNFTQKTKSNGLWSMVHGPLLNRKPRPVFLIIPGTQIMVLMV